jgi:hypothetical protein
VAATTLVVMTAEAGNAGAVSTAAAIVRPATARARTAPVVNAAVATGDGKDPASVAAKTGGATAPGTRDARVARPTTAVPPMTAGPVTIVVLARTTAAATVRTVVVAGTTVAVAGEITVEAARTGEHPVGEAAKVDSIPKAAKVSDHSAARHVRMNRICPTTSKHRNSIRPSAATC